MAKDVVGNDFKLGDVIILSPKAMPDLIICKITGLQEGGLAVPTGIGGQQAIAAGMLRVVMDIAIPFNPTQAVNCVKVVVPAEKQSVN